jgi:hypothetical protein
METEKRSVHGEERYRRIAGVKDLFAILSVAIVVILIGCVAYLLAEKLGINPVWVYLAGVSIAFYTTLGWDYRKEFGSIRFVAFFCSWLAIHLIVFIFVVNQLGWLYWVVALFLEIFFFYATAGWFFGLKPPLRSRRAANRTRK